MVYLKESNGWYELQDLRNSDGEGVVLSQTTLTNGGTLILTEVYQITSEDKFNKTIKIVSASTCFIDL